MLIIHIIDKIFKKIGFKHIYHYLCVDYPNYPYQPILIKNSEKTYLI